MPRMFFPQYRKGRDGAALEEGTILDHARRLGVEIASECGGHGVCGRCVVRIERGAEFLAQKTSAEKEHKLADDERLACQAEVLRPDGDIRVFIRDFGDYTILSESRRADDVALDPFVFRQDDKVLRHPAEVLGPYEGGIYGLAVDVGTTTLVAQVVDLEDGSTVATLARKNPQISYGNDVISRIDHTMRHEGGLEQLQKVVVGAINELLSGVEERPGCIGKAIYDAVIVGNSTMRSIFFGHDVDSLGHIPFEPLTRDAVTASGGELGLSINERGAVYGAPLIGGHAGADALADILASRMYESDDVVMLIDIGTNGEVAIGNKAKIMTASCAAGGAYEGATTKCGVGAIEGAIKNVRIRNDRVEYATIGGKAPVGICGSGLIDLLAELLRSGKMTRKAKIEREFVVTGDIILDQDDIYQLITAKAGLRLDQDLLIKYYGVTLEQVSRIYLAGAFGNFINPQSAVAIGLLPPAVRKISRIGNAALEGARQMLISRDMRARAEQLAQQVEHVKPNEFEPDFAYLVAEKMYF
ncbi:MAG: DUF4445 domain-containing protein [Candidatus Brocadiae bacterium]|nr:DUF4445 domain-containing protein [Candidatus Brocadiia bacterium]